jgi:hypothetical protein
MLCTFRYEEETNSGVEGLHWIGLFSSSSLPREVPEIERCMEISQFCNLLFGRTRILE